LCGAPLNSKSLRDGDAHVSPLAQTIPLTGEGRATGGLAADDHQHGSPETSKVGRAEMESILRRVQAEYVNDGEKAAQDSVETVTPQTTTLAPQLMPTPQPINAAASSNASPAQAVQPVPNVRARRMWQVAAASLLCVALVAGVLAFVLSRRASSADTGGAPPIAISDQKQLVGEKLAEAEALLNSGEFNRAVEVLHAAVKLDPSNVEAHIRLGNALERTGARAEAIEEYHAATQNNPNDVLAWRSLAGAQFEEKLYNDAAESYRHVFAANGSNLDDVSWLAYADALRLSGHTEEARLAYQKISSSTSQAVAQSARDHLAELGPPAASVSTEHTRDVRADQEREPNAATQSPTLSPTPTARATPLSPAIANGANQVDFDSYYFQALNVVNGRDPKKIERADLLRALGLFQRAALGGTHRLEAQRYVDRLGKEYDRRRKL
jgi:tetratricopeptide (TPR) repeat protein